MRTAFLAFALALLFPAFASAQITIGQGIKPAVAVDAAGTAYIAFTGANSSLRFCRLARGTSTCAGQAVLDSSNESLTRPFVSVSGSRVLVAQHRYGGTPFDQVRLYTSLDGGDRFGAGVQIGRVAFDEAITGPGDTITAATYTTTAGGLVQNMGLTAGDPPVANLFPDRPYNGALGFGDGRLVAVFANGAGEAAYRVWDGVGPIGDPSAWSAPAVVGYADYPKAAFGPSGLFLLAGDGANGLYVRRWNGAGFGAAASVTADGDASEAHLFQDAAGRLHAVYSPGVSGVVMHAVSDDGASWRSGAVLTDSAPPGALRVATAPDHVGVVVWTRGPDVVVAPVGPEPAAPVPPPPPPPPPPPAAAPVPRFGQSVVVRPVSGKIRVRLPGTNRFVDLTSLDDVPLGATIDAKRGVLELTAQPRTGAVERIRLDGGWFRVTQNRATTDFTLNEPLARCANRGGRAAQNSKPRSRKLWGNGKGKFRTRGQYSAATIRGTRWLVQDSCAGTLTRVTQGSVLVRHGRRSIVVRAGKRYLARARR